MRSFVKISSPLVFTLLFGPLAMANLTANPGLVEFPTVSIGQRDSTTVWVENIDSMPNNVWTSDTCGNEFQVSSYCQGMLGANGSCDLEIDFVPTTVGSFSCDVFVNGDRGQALIEVQGESASDAPMRDEESLSDPRIP